MFVITVGQIKGGVGKTTLGIAVAGAITKFGRSVTMIDADPQGSAAQWAEPRKLLFPVRHEPLNLRNTLVWVRDVLKIRSDFIIIDTPAGYGTTFDTAVLIADLIVVPCGPSSLDLASAGKTISKVREVRRNDLTPGAFKIVTVPTRVDLSTEEGNQIYDELSEFGEPVAPSLSYDVDFVRSFAAGISVASLPEGTRAFDEAKRLSVFILKQILPRQTGVPA